MTKISETKVPGITKEGMTKVPEIIGIFWVLKLLTTGMGEAMSDFLGKKSIPLAAAIGIFGLGYALWLQMRQREYRAPIYWFAVMMVAIFGTMAADGVHRGANLSYAVTTPLCAIAVAGVFFVWYRSEGTLSIHSITTRRRESFYWVAVLATFALGTAAGDLTAISLNIGYLDSAVLFAAIMAIPAIGWWRFNLNPIVAFWFAYIVTRPLGASFADWFSKPTAHSGLGLGDGTVSAIALLVFIALVAYVAVTRRDVQAGAQADVQAGAQLDIQAGAQDERHFVNPNPNPNQPLHPHPHPHHHHHPQPHPLLEAELD